MKTQCPLCECKKWFWRGICSDCKRLFDVVRKNLGSMGLGQLMDELIATQIPKDRIKRFLENDPMGTGSVMDQILAELTNNLASGIGVKEADIKPQDVKKIRNHPTHGASSKPLKE